MRKCLVTFILSGSLALAPAFCSHADPGSMEVSADAGVDGGYDAHSGQDDAVTGPADAGDAGMGPDRSDKGSGLDAAGPAGQPPDQGDAPDAPDAPDGSGSIPDDSLLDAPAGPAPDDGLDGLDAGAMDALDGASDGDGPLVGVPIDPDQDAKDALLDALLDILEDKGASMEGVSDDVLKKEVSAGEKEKAPAGDGEVTLSDAPDALDAPEDDEEGMDPAPALSQDALVSCAHLLLVGDVLLAVLIGCVCASIFSRFLKWY